MRSSAKGWLGCMHVCSCVGHISAACTAPGCCPRTAPACCHRTAPACCHRTAPACCHRTAPACCHRTAPACCHNTAHGCCHRTAPACCHRTAPGCCHQVGDVIYIEANSGAVKRVGRCDAYATEFDLEAEEYVPLPKVGAGLKSIMCTVTVAVGHRLVIGWDMRMGCRSNCRQKTYHCRHIATGASALKCSHGRGLHGEAGPWLLQCMLVSHGLTTCSCGLGECSGYFSHSHSHCPSGLSATADLWRFSSIKYQWAMHPHTSCACNSLLCCAVLCCAG
jgi:hypothetical protein